MGTSTPTYHRVSYRRVPWYHTRTVLCYGLVWLPICMYRMYDSTWGPVVPGGPYEQL